MRAVAVLLVVMDHMMGVSPFAQSYDWWVLGRLGVLLFFVHTSLVLMASLERGGDAAGWVGSFYLRRAFRIYPLAIVCILAVTALRLPTAFPAKTVVANLLLVQNLTTGTGDVIGVLWSLPIEVQMYLLLPFCFRVAQGSDRRMALLIAGFVALGLIVMLPLPAVWRLSVFLFGPCFTGGVLAYHLLRRARSAQIPAALWLPLLALVSGGVMLVHPTPERVWLGWAPCLVLGWLIPQVRELGRSALTRVAHRIAQYSYGIYLVHKPLLTLWREAPAPSAVQWAGWVLSVIAVSGALYVVVESPMIRLGGRLAARAPHATPAPNMVAGVTGKSPASVTGIEVAGPRLKSGRPD
jgi:peptidoglycan/LPS O-acetylase OafA/YrhL